MHKLVTGFFICTLSAGMLIGGGFNLYEFGARSSTLGGAVVAQAYDASTIFYNPSGLAFLPGTNFYGGVTLITSTAKYTGAQPTWGGAEHETESQWFSPIGIYLSHQFSGRFSAGIGVTNPFGLGVKWADDFPGDYISRKSQIISYYFSPVFAFKITPELSIGGGPDFVYSSVDLIQGLYPFKGPGSTGPEVGSAELEGGSGVGVGFSASAMYKTERAAIGFLYRHKVTNKYDNGDATFTYDENADPNALAFAKQNITDQKVNTEVTFPNFLSIGAHYLLTPQFGVEVDVMWFRWEVVNELALDFETLPTTVLNLDYENSWQVRVGAHYEATEKLSFRAGYIYDQTPQPLKSMGPLLPDAKRNDFTAGIGYNFGRVQVDAGYMLVNFLERSTVEDGVGKNENNFDGAYDTDANLIFLSLGINLKK